MNNVVLSGAFFNAADPTGVERYAIILTKELDKIVEKGRVTVLIPTYAGPVPNLENISIVRYGSLKLFLWKQLSLPYYAIKHHALVVDLCWSMPFIKNDIACIFDCQHEVYPDNYVSLKEKLQHLYFNMRVHRTASHSGRIITISETAKLDIEKYYSVNDKRISVLPCAWQHINDVACDNQIFNRFGILKTGNYYFALGSGFRHKNFKWLYYAAKTNPCSLFVITGNDRISAYSAELNMMKLDNLIFTGYLTDGQMKALMANCKAFIQPTLYEGFGIPPLEALACGVDIMISDIPVMHEIYEDAARYFDPLDYNNINIGSIMSQKIGDSIRILKKYSWAMSARLLLDILQKEVAATK